jgi:hypothetical protein
MGSARRDLLEEQDISFLCPLSPHHDALRGANIAIAVTSSTPEFGESSLAMSLTAA